MALNQQQLGEIKWALGALAGQLRGYSRAELFASYARYYAGDHPLLFATPKFLETFGHTFKAHVENLCRVPLDIQTDLLQVEGFAVRGGEDAASDANEIWRRNRMDERAGQVHKNTGLFSESFVIAWPDSESGEAVIYPNLPGNVVVKYHAERLGYIIEAAKFWTQDDGFGYLTHYTPETITRYRTKNKANTGTMAVAGAFDLYETDATPAIVGNEFGKVPVFRFVNNAGVGGVGESEIHDLRGPQDALNKAKADMLLAAEYTAYPQKYALGYEIKKDPVTQEAINPFKSGPDRMWAIKDPAATIGQLPAADLKPFLDMMNDARMSIARISGTPPHYFGMDTGGWPSGESLKTASERLIRKVIDRQISFGNTWSDVMRFCLQIEGKADIELSTLWNDPTPRASESEAIAAAIAKQGLGVPTGVVLQELGYSPEQATEWAAALEGDGFPDLSAGGGGDTQS